MLCLSIVVSHLTLDELGNLHFLFAIEGIGVGCSLFALLTTDNIVVAEELHNLLYLVLDGEARGLHVVDQQGGDVVDGCREDELVGLRDIADHEEDVDHPDGQLRVTLIGACHTDGIINRLLSTSLQALLKHIVVQFVEGDELAQFGIGIGLCRRVDDLDDASLVALHLLGDIAQGEERVEHLHDELELIGHKGIVGHEVLLAVVAAVGVGQLELEVKSSFLAVVQCLQVGLHLLFLVENTLLGNDLGLCAFERHLHLEASLDLAFLVFLLGYVAVVHNLGEVLLGSTCHPYLVLTCLGEFGDNLLKVEVAVTFLVDELAHFIGKKNQTVVIALVFEVGGQFHTEAVDAEYGVALDDALAYAIHRECRCQFLGNVEHPVQFVVYEVGSHTRVIPVASLLSYTLLESFKHTFFLQGLFEVLSQGDIELM